MEKECGHRNALRTKIDADMPFIIYFTEKLSALNNCLLKLIA